MYKIKKGTGPAAFHAKFKMLSPSYKTRFSSVNYRKPKLDYAKVGSGYFYEVQLHGTILLLIQRKNFNIALFLNQKSKLNS